jgi:hypothetical protein
MGKQKKLLCKGQITKKITGGKTKFVYITGGKDLFTHNFI